MRGRDKFNKIKPLLNFTIVFFRLFPYKTRVSLFEFFRDTKGYKGIALRYCLLKTISKGVGNNVAIFPNCYILHTKELLIGNNVSIHPFCYIDAFGGCEIGNDVSIAHGVSIITFQHSFENLSGNIKDSTVRICPVRIMDDVWIGMKAVVMGCTNEVSVIGNHSVIAACAMVNKNVAERTVVGGVPAKVIKTIEGVV